MLFRISFLIPSFGISYASYTFIGISFFKLAKFSSKIVLVLFSKPFVLGFVSFLYFYFFTYLVSSYYLRFLGCFFFSQEIFRFNISFEQGINFCYYFFSAWDTPSSLTLYWWGLPLRFLFDFLNCSFTYFFQFGFSLFIHFYILFLFSSSVSLWFHRFH